VDGRPLRPLVRVKARIQGSGRAADLGVVTVRPVAAIVPTYVRKPEELDVLLRCLVSLKATAPQAMVLVVDDHSPAPELVHQLQVAADELGIAFVAKDENTGFAQTVNVGLELARAEGWDAVLVNADIEFTERGWLERMQARTDTQGRPAAVVGARLLYPNGLIQHAGIFFSLLRRDFFHRFHFGPADLPEAQEPCRCPVTAALKLIRHETLETVGIYDPEFQLAYEDVDYCLRVFEAGLDCIYEPTVTAIHHESYFRKRNPTAKIRAWSLQSQARLISKWTNFDMSRFTPDPL
jgi:GT2 family glycosyltransferase